MVGLGEDRQGVLQVMDDMRAAEIDFMTIGQYLQPTPKHHAIDRFVTPEEFAAYEKAARGKGFLMVSATPLTRSSYHAGDDFARLRAALVSCNYTGLSAGQGLQIGGDCSAVFCWQFRNIFDHICHFAASRIKFWRKARS